MQIRKATTFEWLLGATTIIIFVVMMVRDCQYDKILEEQQRQHTASLRAIGEDLDIVDMENTTLKKLLRERDYQPVLPKPQYIIQTRVETVEKEVVVRIPSENCQDMVTDYTYTWNQLPVAHYGYDGYEQVFTTPVVVLDVETELNEHHAVSHVYATSSLEPSERFLLQSSTLPLRITQDASQRLLRPSWGWYVAGLVTGVGVTAGYVKLAGEL
jgi:hypothetical protein